MDSGPSIFPRMIRPNHLHNMTPSKDGRGAKIGVPVPLLRHVWLVSLRIVEYVAEAFMAELDGGGVLAVGFEGGAAGDAAHGWGFGVVGRCDGDVVLWDSMKLWNTIPETRLRWAVECSVGGMRG